MFLMVHHSNSLISKDKMCSSSYDWQQPGDDNHLCHLPVLRSKSRIGCFCTKSNPAAVKSIQSMVSRRCLHLSNTPRVLSHHASGNRQLLTSDCHLCLKLQVKHVCALQTPAILCCCGICCCCCWPQGCVCLPASITFLAKVAYTSCVCSSFVVHCTDVETDIGYEKAVETTLA